VNKPTRIEHEGLTAPAEFGRQNTDSLLLDEVRSQGRLFRLKHPVRIEVRNLADGWCYESKTLAILAFGRSEQEARDSFNEDFAVLWDAIAQAPDESLTGDAIAVKDAFQQLVGTVVRE
jgi:hypothetical protein